MTKLVDLRGSLRVDRFEEVSVSYAAPVISQPVPIMPPGDVVGLRNDFEANDPRRFVTVGYLPRVYGTRYTLPQAFKFRFSDRCKMTYEWAKLSYDLQKHYAPKRFMTDPPIPIGPNDDWLMGHTPKNRMDEWYLHLHTHDRFINNGVGWNSPGFYDPVTGFGSGNNPYEQEGITTGGNYMWSAGTDGNYERVWCLDYLAPAPPVDLLVKYGGFFLYHIATQCTPRVIDKTPRPEIDCPNGIFEIIEFPQGEGNLVPYLCLSREPSMPTMTWNGLHLRQNMVTRVRVKSWPGDPRITYPYIPEKPLIVEL
jgi:hypothetical protein